MAIQKGSKVSFDYCLTVDGEVVDSSKEREPLTYIHGEGRIIPGLAKELEGLSAGDQKNVEVSPKEAYGEVNPKALQEVPKERMPQGLELKEGMLLQAQRSENDAGLPIRVAEVKENTVVLDFNHPLAGKTLVFDVKIVTVE